MDTIKVALLGFGTVGKGVYDTIHTHQGRLQSILGKRVEVVGILVKDKNKKRSISDNVLISSDINQILQIQDIDIVIEAIVGVEPGYTYLSKAIERKLHVITANKELLAHKGKELKQKADRFGVRLEYEATVGGGIPIISTIKHLLKVNSVVKIEAILNGTSNYILTDIRENNSSFNNSLLRAQERGYAEADPSNDIDGWDAFFKLMIINELIYGDQPEWSKTEHKGIRNIEYKHIIAAQSFGYRIKHIASLEYSNGIIRTAVEPKIVADSHPLYSVEGVDNAVIITGDLIGQLKLHGPGAGALPTASAIIEDLVNVFQINDQKPIYSNVRFHPFGNSEIQDWMLVGDRLNSSSITILEQKKLDSSVTSWLVSGKEDHIKRLIEHSPKLSGYPKSITPIKEKRAIIQ